MSKLIENIEYKICPSFPEYLVSRCGKVRRKSTLKLMKTNARGDNCKYPAVRTCINNVVKNTPLHRLVAETWLPKSEDTEKVYVNHIDGNTKNPHVDNLEWVTLSENQRHALQIGLKQKGSELYNSQLDEEKVHQICKHLVDGWIVKDIAEKFDVSRDIIRKIKSGDTYFHVRSLYEIPHTYLYDYSESTVKWVCQQIVNGNSDAGIVKLSNNTNLTIIEVKRIRYKIRYKLISDNYF